MPERSMLGKRLGHLGRVQVKEIDIFKMVQFYEDGGWQPSIKEELGDRQIESAVQVTYLDENGEEYDSGVILVFTDDETIFTLHHVDSPRVKEINFSS